MPTSETRSQLYTIFPVAVQVSDIPGAADLNQELLRAVHEVMRTTPNNLPESWACHVYTTIGSPLELLARQEFARLKQHIQAEAERYADSLRMDRQKYPLRIRECWLNVYSTRDAQEVHCHADSLISGVYYVKAPPGSSPLSVYSPTADVMLTAPYTQMTELNCKNGLFDAVDGRMIIFPSWLRHSVKPSKITDERVSIAFNITM